jgi:shikimate dehydrogenase
MNHKKNTFQLDHFDHYAVMGNPIAHSKSPLIHAAFAKQTHQTLQYDAILVDTQEGEFAKAVKNFQKAGGKGLNITVPFKQVAWALAEKRTDRAECAGAVNTLLFDGQGRCIGENTDGIGLVYDLTQNHGCQIDGQRVLILGAGGAVRGLLRPLLELTNPTECVIANRTISKAENLASLFSSYGKISASSYDALQSQSFDLIINGTSASLQGQSLPLPDGLVAKEGWCYDLMYANTATIFMQWAQQQGAAHVLDGLGMLVEQAAVSFHLWRGVRPDTAPVIRQLRGSVDNTENLSARPGLKPGLVSNTPSIEIGGPQGIEPTRYGDWERKGRCIDF